MNDYHSYIPPHGTTVTRVMTREERRHVGRIEYAKTAARELRLMSTLFNGAAKFINAGSYGCTVSLHFSKVAVLVQFSARDGIIWTPSPMRLPYTADCEGRTTFHSWLAGQDPTFIARLLKNAHKKLRDHKAYEGTLRARRERDIAILKQRQNIEPYSTL